MAESKKKSVVVIGGGTGTHAVLTGLKKYKKQLDLTAVVAMTDSGGSTGRLRDEFGYLPVGDVRMALVALASDIDAHKELVRKLFLHRFDKGNGLSGHNFGNLLIVALTDILGSEEEAINVAGEILQVEGRVIPVTTEKTHLVAKYEDGVVVKGEHDIDEPMKERNGNRIVDLYVEPVANIGKSAERAILGADLIVLGPGDVYTSVLTNCVIGGVSEAIQRSEAKVIYISNLMTKAGQTSGMGVSEHILEISKYIGKTPDHVIVNTASFEDGLLDKYSLQEEYPVEVNCGEEGCNIVLGEFAAKQKVVTSKGDTLRRSLVRHDPSRLAGAIVDLL